MSKPLIGPSLPPNWSQINERRDRNEVFGPTLPPNYGSEPQKQSEDRVIGPTLPKDYKHKKYAVNDSDSDSEDMIGPIPQSHHNYHKLDQKFGNLSQVLAKKESERELKKERELWMTEVPKPLATKLFTKSVTHFSQRPVKSDDKNSDKKHKKDDKKEKELNEIMDSLNKSQKRDVSLIDIHKHKSKKAKEETKLEERVAFDPEKDLKVRKMNSRQTQSVLNKAKTFNDRFSLGVNKFL